MIKANDPKLKSWIKVKKDSDFPIQNIPFGMFSKGRIKARPATIIGTTVIDLKALSDLDFFDGIDFDKKALNQSTLNDFIKLGRPVWRAIRQRISDLFNKKNKELQDNEAAQEKVLHKVEEVEMLMPIHVGDYTDFYASKEHATNVGTMFRGAENALMPNWLHLPVGYHGRSSSIVLSGTPLHRPKGQTRPDPEQPPVFGASKLVDFELEVACIAGQGKPLGQNITVAEADEHLFGIALFNDWSARDIQKWEYVPLGPFLGKSFGSSLSAWIVTLDALEPFRMRPAKREVPILPYLEGKENRRININLEVQIQPEDGEAHTVSRSNLKYMYWTIEQQLAHHTINGCNIKAGDILASGTISGTKPDSYGSMLELSWRGEKPLQMPDGSERKFLKDGDTVIMKGYAEKDGVRIGFGEVSGQILPAL